MEHTMFQFSPIGESFCSKKKGWSPSENWYSSNTARNWKHSSRQNKKNFLFRWLRAKCLITCAKRTVISLRVFLRSLANIRWCLAKLQPQVTFNITILTVSWPCIHNVSLPTYNTWSKFIYFFQFVIFMQISFTPEIINTKHHSETR